jgi:hypothetical protein
VGLEIVGRLSDTESQPGTYVAIVSEVIWKLGQKVRVQTDSPEVVKLTNIYVSEREYSAFRWIGCNGPEQDPLALGVRWTSNGGG